MHINLFGTTLRIRGKKFKQNLPKTCSKSTKIATTIRKFSKFFRGSKPPDLPRAFFILNLLHNNSAEKLRLKICRNWVPPT